MTPEDLVEIELIKQLKYRYMRCVDRKLWSELPDCFTEGARPEKTDVEAPSGAGSQPTVDW